MRIQNQRLVFLFVIFTLLATSISSGVSFIYSYSHFKANTENQLSASADTYGHELNAILKSVETAVETVRSNLEVSLDATQINQPSYYDAIEPNLEAIGRKFDHNEINTTSFYIRFDPLLSSGTSGIFHADTNGDGIMETLAPTDISQYRESDIERVGWFYIPMTFERGAWMEPYFNANINTYMVSYVSPIKVAGKTIGIIGMDVDFKTLKKIADSHRGAGKVVLLDTHYGFMVHDNFLPTERIDTIDGGKLAFMRDIIANQTHGTIHYQLNGIDKVLGFSKLINQWTVIVALTEEEAFDSFNRTTSTLLWINIIVALLITALAIAFSRYVHRLVNVNSNLTSEVAERSRQLQETNEYLEETVAELESQQAELTLVNQQLEESLRTQRDMQSKLIEKEKLSSLAQLIASIAHELNTPVGNAIALNSFLNEQITEIQRLIPTSISPDAALSTAITNLSDACQLSANTLDRVAGIVEHFKLLTDPLNSIDVKQLRIKALVQEQLSPFQEQIVRDNHKVDIEIEDDLTLLTSEIVLSQILIQLFKNALIHGLTGREASHIGIRCWRKEHIIHLEIADTGKGMSESILKRACHPFFTTRQNKGSVGLGLHIVYNLVTNALNGTLAIRSEPDTGTTVVIEFPEFGQ